MKNLLSKPYRWAIIFSILLTGSFTYALMDTFVIPKTYKPILSPTEVAKGVNENQSNETSPSEEVQSEETQSKAVVTDNSYKDSNIAIKISTIREYDTSVYIADIQIKKASYLKTALANNTYGRNIKKTTSKIADSNNAIFAINGDFYGFRDYGYVLRNGTLYRDTASNSEDLVINNEGDLSVIDENKISIDTMDLSSIRQIISFGPALVEKGNMVVDSNSRVAKEMKSNPRTAIGQISPLHYIFIVSDGRSDKSKGLSLKQLAQVFKDKGCNTAYNLDGGGSSTMYFNGNIVNIPTDGRTMGQREVSDIVYIGY